MAASCTPPARDEPTTREARRRPFGAQDTLNHASPAGDKGTDFKNHRLLPKDVHDSSANYKEQAGLRGKSWDLSNQDSL